MVLDLATVSPIEIIGVVLLLSIFSYFSFKKNSLDQEGIIAALIIGIVCYMLGGLPILLVVVAFYIIAEFSTRLGRMKFGDVHEKRTTGNILGNAGAAMIALILGQLPAFFGSISAALADTISSEIGMMSNGKPRLITRPWIKVHPGTDGGVTFLGLAAGLAGGIAMGIIYYYLGMVYYNSNPDFMVIPIIAFSGFCGTLIDSWLGAVFEQKHRLSNTSVNFIASCCGGIIAYVLFAVF